MAVIGIGLDIVDVDRLRRAITHPRRGERFKKRVFTELEQRDCDARRSSIQSYAARFAAKEAVVKALASESALSMAWQDVEVRSSSDGRPSIMLHGRMAARAGEMGVGAIHVSLSHDAGIAAAQVVVESA